MKIKKAIIIIAVIILIISLVIYYSVGKSELDHKTEIKFNSLILKGGSGFVGVNPDSMTTDFKIKTRGHTLNSQINLQRDSLIVRYNLPKKSNLFAGFQGFIEVNQEGTDIKYKLDTKHQFIPGRNFYSYDHLILTSSTSTNEIGIFDMDAKEFVVREKVDGECFSITGLNEIAYVTCFNENKNYSTIYLVDLNQPSIETFKTIQEQQINHLVITNENGLIAATIKDSTNHLLQVQVEIKSLKELQHINQKQVKTITISNNHIFLLQEDVEQYQQRYYLSSYNLKDDSYKEKIMGENEVTLDIESVGQEIYLLTRIRQGKNMLYLMNENLDILTDNQIQLDIIPREMMIEKV